jgi:hypothetical protein
MAWRSLKEITPDDPKWAAGWIMPEEPMLRDEPLFEEMKEN